MLVILPPTLAIRVLLHWRKVPRGRVWLPVAILLSVTWLAILESIALSVGVASLDEESPVARMFAGILVFGVGLGLVAYRTNVGQGRVDDPSG